MAADPILRGHAAAPVARRHPAPALPRVLRAAGLDHRRRGPRGQRAARLGQPAPVLRGEVRAARRDLLLRPGGGALPHRALPALPRAPPADARPARRPVGARAGAVRGARLDRDRVGHARGRRPDGRLREGGGRRRRHRPDPHRRPRHVPVRRAGRDRPAPARPPGGAGRDGRGRGRGALRRPAGGGAGLHRAARRPVGRAARREGDRREDRGGAAQAPRHARGRDRRRGAREAVGAARADRAGGRAARVPRDRDAPGRRRRAAAGPGRRTARAAPRRRGRSG